MSSSERAYRGLSADERRAERRAKLIEAGFDVLAQEGVTGTTMKAVRLRSGLTERYFYESFASRDELLTALIAELSRELAAAYVTALDRAAPDLYARSKAGAEAIIGVLADDPRKARAYVESARGGGIKFERTTMYEQHAALVAEQLRAHSDLGEAALKATSLILVFGLANTVAVWLDGGIELSRDDLAEHFARLCVAAVRL